MRVVSLFSGAGGLDLGFKMAGHEIIWANDLYEDAVETYKHNLGDHIVCEDISKIDAKEIPECDIIIGGFPCQGFSVANMKRHEADERNALYKQLIRVIEAKKPKFFLAENVKGLTNLAKGAVFKMILSDFAALGYKVSYRVLNAADYGVPQTRQRVIIIGVRNDGNVVIRQFSDDFQKDFGVKGNDAFLQDIAADDRFDSQLHIVACQLDLPCAGINQNAFQDRHGGFGGNRLHNDIDGVYNGIFLKFQLHNC